MSWGAPEWAAGTADTSSIPLPTPSAKKKFMTEEAKPSAATSLPPKISDLIADGNKID
jgi:hypothetical protein